MSTPYETEWDSWANADTELEELEQHLESLKADLEVEIDLHGGRTVMAYNLRTAIIKVRKELEELKTAV